MSNSRSLRNAARTAQRQVPTARRAVPTIRSTGAGSAVRSGRTVPTDKPPRSVPASAPGQATHPQRIILVLAAAGIVASLMQTVVLPLVGQLPQILHTSASNASWAITVTLLVAAVATPVIGRLGDLHGKRSMLLFCTVPLVVGSVVCALSDSLAPMVVGRGLQGLGVGMIPLGISAMRDALPPARLGSGIALMSSSMGIGGALGLPLSALVANSLSWRALFWMSAGLVVVIAVLIWRFIPALASHHKGRLDYVGAVGLGAALLSLMLAVTKGTDWGWGSPTTLSLLAAAVVLLPGWGWWELRSTEPLVDLRTAARRQVLVTNLASVLLGFVMLAQSLILMQLLQLPRATGYGLGQSMLAAGLWLAPGGLMMTAVSSWGARLSRARGARTTLALGALVLAAGYGVGLALMSWAWGLMLASAVASAGVGLAYGAMPALIMGAVPLSETAAANSFNALMRSLGTTAASAVIGVVLATMSTPFGAYRLPTEAGFRVSLVISCVVALAGAAVALALPRRRPPTETVTVTAPTALRPEPAPAPA